MDENYGATPPPPAQAPPVDVALAGAVLPVQLVAELLEPPEIGGGWRDVDGAELFVEGAGAPRYAFAMAGRSTAADLAALGTVARPGAAAADVVAVAAPHHPPAAVASLHPPPRAVMALPAAVTAAVPPSWAAAAPPPVYADTLAMRPAPPATVLFRAPAAIQKFAAAAAARHAAAASSAPPPEPPPESGDGGRGGRRKRRRDQRNQASQTALYNRARRRRLGNLVGELGRLTALEGASTADILQAAGDRLQRLAAVAVPRPSETPPGVPVDLLVSAELSQAVAFVDMRGSLVAGNGALRRLLGYSRAEMAAGGVPMQRYLPERDLPRLRARLGLAVEGHFVSVRDTRLWLCSDRRQLWLSSTVSLAFDEANPSRSLFVMPVKPAGARPCNAAEACGSRGGTVVDEANIG